MQQAMVLDIMPLPTKVVRSANDRARSGAVAGHLPPRPLPSCVGSPESVIGPPIQARLALTDIMSPDR